MRSFTVEVPDAIALISGWPAAFAGADMVHTSSCCPSQGLSGSGLKEYLVESSLESVEFPWKYQVAGIELVLIVSFFLVNA